MGLSLSGIKSAALGAISDVPGSHYVAGHTLNALSDVNTAFGGQANNVGNAILNPNVNYKGASNPVSKSNTVGGKSATTNATSNSVAATGGTSSGGGGSNISTILNQIADSQNSLLDKYGNSAASSAQQLQGQASDLVGQIQSGQQNINSEIQNAEQNKQQSITALLNQLHQNTQSDAVKLSSSNALGSSAANALARGEVNYGNQQRGVIGGQEQAALQQTGNEQNTLNNQLSVGKAQLQQARDNIVSNISLQADSDLRQLDYQAQNVGMAGKVQIDALKNQIVNAAVQKLGAVDQFVTQQLAGTQPISTADAAAKAYQAIQAGQTNAGNPFTFNEANNPSSGVGGTGNQVAQAQSQAVDANGNPEAGAPTAILPSLIKKDPNAPVTG